MGIYTIRLKGSGKIQAVFMEVKQNRIGYKPQNCIFTQGCGSSVELRDFARRAVELSPQAEGLGTSGCRILVPDPPALQVQQPDFGNALKVDQTLEEPTQTTQAHRRFMYKPKFTPLIKSKN